MTFHYEIHGLHLASEVALPELRLRPCGPGTAEPDIRIEVGRVPVEVAAPMTTTEGYQVGPDEVLMVVPEVGRYMARQGRVLIVEENAAADQAAVRLYLLGSGLAALLHQRGFVPLHASAIVHDGRCFAFVGDSGAGKSTLAAMLARRGYRLLSDDVLALRLGGSGAVLAQPGAPLVKLWPESLPYSAFAEMQAPFECRDFHKHRIGAPESFTETAVPLAKIYLLHWLLPASAEPEIEVIPGFDALVALRRNVYRPTLLDALGREGEFMRLAHAALPTGQFFAFRRAMNLDRADAQVDALEAHFLRS